MYRVAGGPDVAAKLLTAARGELGRLRPPYAARFQRAATDVLAERARAGVRPADVAEWRKTILQVAAAEPLTKEMIEARSDPALERLEAVLTVAPTDVLEAHPRLADDRRHLLALADIVRRCVASVPDPPRKPGQPDADAGSLAEDIVATEELACLLAGPLTPVDRQVVAACRVHSRDMEERGFFDHQSPVPGRATPWARAEAAGTSASAENIFSGVDDGRAAIEGWWHSPGHHKNMLGGQQRTGLGRWKQFWTQLFG